MCETLAISQEGAEEMASCRAPLAKHGSHLVGATTDAVKKPAHTGRLRQWWLKKVERLTQSIYVSSATTDS